MLSCTPSQMRVGVSELIWHGQFSLNFLFKIIILANVGLKWIWSISFFRFPTCKSEYMGAYVCVFVYVNKHACVCVCLCILVTQYIYAHVSVHMQVYVCGVPNIKFVSLAYMPNEPKSAKSEKSIWFNVCLYASIYLCVSAAFYVCMYVCVVPNTKNRSMGTLAHLAI